MVKVIGGTGLVGSHLLCELVKSENQIYASYRTKSNISNVKKIFDFYFSEKSDSLWERILWQYVDVNDIVSLDDFIAEDDEVYHCAALVSFNRMDFNKLMNINREGTTNVVNVSLDMKIKKLCYVSSTAAITGGEIKNVSEVSRWKKSDDTGPYSISKYGAEREVWRGVEEGLSAVIVNPCVILGAGNWNDSSLTILKQMQKGLSFYPPGSNAIVDARDVASCMVQLMKNEFTNERYLLIGENTSFKNLLDKIALRLGNKPPKYAVGKIGLTLARFFIGFVAFISRNNSTITIDTVNSSLANTVYDNEKIKSALKYTFHTLDETIDNAVKGQITQA